MSLSTRAPIEKRSDNRTDRFSPQAKGQLQSEAPRIVVIGGGSGSSVILNGLKRYEAEITAIVSMFDSGGSSGLLRTEFGYPPFGDLRQCLLALSEDSETAQTLQPLLDFRFHKDSSLQGHNLGNLMLAGLTSLSDLEGAVNSLSQVLKIRGRVVPVSLDKGDLCAELEDRSILRGETKIDLRGRPLPRIEKVFLEPAASANPRAVQAILEADVVVLGPGDLYTSIIPNLLVCGIPEALKQTSATLIYVCNLMTKMGETDDFAASDFVAEINRYLRGAKIDWALVNTAAISPEITGKYAMEGARLVEPDLERLLDQGVKYLGSPVVGCQDPVRHHSELLANGILNLVHSNPRHEYSQENLRRISIFS